MLPRIIAKWPGKVHTYSYSPAIVGAVKDMVSDSPGPSSLVYAKTSPSKDLGRGLVALPPDAKTF